MYVANLIFQIMRTMLQAAGPATAQVTHIPAYKPGTGAQGGLARIKAFQAFFKVNKVKDHFNSC